MTDYLSGEDNLMAFVCQIILVFTQTSYYLPINMCTYTPQLQKLTNKLNIFNDQYNLFVKLFIK